MVQLSSDCNPRKLSGTASPRPPDVRAGAGHDKVMELTSHVIGNYSIQDLCLAGRMLRKAALVHSKQVLLPLMV